jgi:hypothetical protein
MEASAKAQSRNESKTGCERHFYNRSVVNSNQLPNFAKLNGARGRRSRIGYLLKQQ